VQGVVGSNPTVPTKYSNKIKHLEQNGFKCFFVF